MRTVFLAVFGAGYGLLAAAGVFTVLAAVGLVPRFAGKTHTGSQVILYEEAVIFGTIFGGLLSIFFRYLRPGAWLQQRFPGQIPALWMAGDVFQGIFGIFSGMFIGCLALAIAEMLDSIPVFARRISFRHGIGIAILGVALGKLCGSLAYFAAELHRTAS